MANIGIAKASYYADTSINRLNRDLDNSVDRVATAKKNVTASDIASLKSMDYSFRLDFAATKAAVKSMSVTQAYLSTAISSLENSAAILAKIHGLAVLGANGSNSDADQTAINTEANELADEFHKSMINSNFKGQKVFKEDGFDSTMSLGPTTSKFADFGAGTIDYDFFYDYENPNISTLDAGVTYEVKRDLTDAEKEAILSRTTGLSAESLVVGTKFTTNPVENINRGGGTMSVISEAAPSNNTKTYNRGDNRVRFDPGATFNQAGNFKGGFVDLEVTGNIETSDTLSLQNTTRLENGQAIDSIRITNGIVSYNDPVHGFIDVGKIVDETNGANGKKLRVQLFDDASIPGTGILENGNFEKQLLDIGNQPTKTYTAGEHRMGVVGNYTVSGGAGYTQKNDTLTTGLARGSDTYSLNFTGGTGTGFRAHVNVVGGSVQIVEVIDKGKGYTAGDVLTLNNAVELGGAGNGFQVTVNSIVNSLGDGNGTQGVELVKTPNFTDIPAVVRHTTNDRYAWGEPYAIGEVVREAVPDGQNQAGDILSFYQHDAAGSYANDPNWVGIANTTLNPNYALNQRVREQIAIGDQQAGDTTIYATDPNTGQVIVDQIAVGQQQAGDRAVIAGTLQIPVGQQQAGDRAVVNGVVQIPVGQQQAGDRAVVNGVVQIPVGQQQPGDRAVNATNAQGGTYSWGETYQAGSLKKTLVGGDTPTNVFHTQPGTYNFDATGTNFNLQYQAGAPALERIEVGNQVGTDTPVMGVGEGAGVAFYTRQQTVNTTIEISHYERDNITHYERDNITHYLRDDITHYERDRVAFYTREKSLYTRQQVNGTIRKYVGETIGNQQAHTGWTQGTTPAIQNWYSSDANRVLFGSGNTNGSFTITDTENGTLINSSTQDGSYSNNSKTITVPTPSWQDMASPAYADFTDNFGNTRSSTPAVEDRDNHPLRYGPGVKAGVGNSTDPSVELINSNGGKAVKLDTGYMEFQDGNGFGIYHGPAIVSDEFTITADRPKIVRLDYTAAGINDDYHVAGYIYEVNPNTGAAIIDPATGKAKITMAVNETATTEQAGRAGIEVPGAGTYRFVFVVGTHDLTGGLVAGADMTVDNIIAEDPYEITDNIIQELLRAVHYENAATSAAASKTLTATVENADESLFLRDNALINMAGFDSIGTDGPYMIVPSNNLVTSPSEGATVGSANKLTAKIELVQEKLNIAMMNAVSQYKAIESAMDSSTDLRSQFALASGTLSDLNFSQETAYIAKRQIQQDIATTMLAQANKSQLDLMMLVEE